LRNSSHRFYFADSKRCVSFTRFGISVEDIEHYFPNSVGSAFNIAKVDWIATNLKHVWCRSQSSELGPNIFHFLDTKDATIFRLRWK